MVFFQIGINRSLYRSHVYLRYYLLKPYISIIYLFTEVYVLSFKCKNIVWPSNPKAYVGCPCQTIRDVSTDCLFGFLKYSNIFHAPYYI